MTENADCLMVNAVPAKPPARRTAAMTGRMALSIILGNAAYSAWAGVHDVWRGHGRRRC